MRILLIKTSSMGDVIHALPALTDAWRAVPALRCDWVVEEGFQQIPGWHPAVDNVLPVAIRRWRKQPLTAWRSGEWRAFKTQLQATRYDAVIDAQGLLKSAWLTRLAQGPRFGFDRKSAREPLSVFAYDRQLAVAKNQHAVTRVRQLLAQSLGYALDPLALDYGIRDTLASGHHIAASDAPARTVILLHSTTWPTKHWPEAYWTSLARLLSAQGFQPLLPWGNPLEQQRAERIATAGGGKVLPALSLRELAVLMTESSGCVAVDTGLAHLAAALAVPTVTLFGPTDPALTGTFGRHQAQLQSGFHCAPCLSKQCRVASADSALFPPCFREISPDQVLAALMRQQQATQTNPETNR